jgi:hypothetical protein
MKNLFKSTATAASMRAGVWREFYLQLLDKGMRPEMARLALARKIAAIAERSGSRVSIDAGLGAESHGAPYAPSDNPTKQ